MEIPIGLIEYVTRYMVGQGSGASIDSAALTDLIEGTLGMFEDETGVRFGAPAESITWTTQVGGVKSFSVLPLATVTSIEWALWPASASWSAIDSGTYLQIGRIIHRNIPFYRGFVRVTATVGFDSIDDMPPSIKKAIAEMVGIAWRGKRGVRPTTPTDGADDNRNPIPPHVWRTLRKYRQSAIA